MKILTVKLLSPVFNDGMKSIGAKVHKATITEERSGVVITRALPYGSVFVPWHNVSWCEVELDLPKAKATAA